MPKIIIIAQFRPEILQIKYCELLMVCPGMSDHTHKNGLKQFINA